MTDGIDRTQSAHGEQDDHQELKSGLFHDATSRVVGNVSSEVKEVAQELFKHGYIEEAASPVLFRKAVVHERAIHEALAPFDLTLRLDTHRGVVIVAVADVVFQSLGPDQVWSHPLVRRQRLTLEQSLLVAILRQVFMIHEQESGIGQAAAKMSVDDVLSQFLTYFDDSGSDARNESRLMNLLDQLKIHGIVSEVDSNHEFTIRPIIAHLANAESLSALLQVLTQKANTDQRSESEQR